MRHQTRSLSLKDCYEILEVARDATLEDVKHAYRQKAFALHPDLNPDDPLASKKFQLVNEAYVALSEVLKAEERKEESGDKKTEQKQKEGNKQQEKKRAQAQQAYAEQDVLRDLLNDPFARRVFEDIYSELNRKQAENSAKNRQEEKPEPPRQKKPVTQKTVHKEPILPKTKKDPQVQTKGGMGDMVKSWLRRQIDEELTLYLPAQKLTPGTRVRLQISHAFTSEPQTIEVTLPPDFVVGKPIRLRGLGKHVGPWQGDLYLTLQKKLS